MLKKDLAIEYILNEVEHQAWQKLDDEDMDCMKLATFANENTNFVVIQNCQDGKLYKVPFSYNTDNKEVTFGEKEEVEEVFLEKQLEGNINDVTFEDVKKGLNPLEKLVIYKEVYGEYPEITVKRKENYLEGEIVSKNNERRLVSGPVLIPDEPDYDGDIISKEKIEEVAHEWMLKYRNSDLQHTLNNVAYPVESFISKEEKVMENINGEEVTIPAGSWMLTSKVQDDDTWGSVKNGELRGYSIMGVPKSAVVKGKEVVVKRTTLADIEESGYDWTVPFVSLVDEPAVPKGIYTAVKNKNKKEDEEETVDKDLWGRFKNFLSFKNSEDIEDDANKSNERGDSEMDEEKLQEILQSFKDEVKEMIDSSDKEENKEEEVEKEIEDNEEEVEKNEGDEEVEEEEEVEEVEKEEPEENEEVENLKSKLDKQEETIENLKSDNDELKETLEAIKDKFTNTNKSNQPAGQEGEEEKETVTIKDRMEGLDRDSLGRKIK